VTGRVGRDVFIGEESERGGAGTWFIGARGTGPNVGSSRATIRDAFRVSGGVTVLDVLAVRLF
jgi:hypothetical protein